MGVGFCVAALLWLAALSIYDVRYRRFRCCRLAHSKAASFNPSTAHERLRGSQHVFGIVEEFCSQYAGNSATSAQNGFAKPSPALRHDDARRG
jgi:hypothetical protein